MTYKILEYPLKITETQKVTTVDGDILSIKNLNDKIVMYVLFDTKYENWESEWEILIVPTGAPCDDLHLDPLKNIYGERIDCNTHQFLATVDILGDDPVLPLVFHVFGKKLC